MTPSTHPYADHAELSTLRLSAFTFEKGDYRQINHSLTWELRAQEVFSQHSSYPDKGFRTDAAPSFDMAPGVYTIEVTCELGSKTIEDVVLHPGAVVDEVVYFGQMGMDDQEEQFDLSDDEAFDSASEFIRRHDEREGQREFGQSNDALRDPDLMPEAPPGHEYDQSVEARNQTQAHPILSQAKQFDGIAANQNPDTSRNQHAAEAQLQPDLAPGAKPSPTITTPTPRPFH